MIMIDKSIEKYFDYNGTHALINILKAAQYIFSHSKDEPLLDEILELSGIGMDAPIFLKYMDEQLEVLEMKSSSTLSFKKMSHSPKQLQGNVITRLYYALYWAYGLDKKEVFDYPQRLARIVLLFHKYYLQYKAEEKRKLSKNEFRDQDFFDDCAQGLVRALEYMAAMVREDNEYLNEVYFPKKDSIDLGEHLFKIATTDVIEKNHFFIMKQESKDENYLLYENVSEDIRIKVQSSRRIQSGSDEKTKRNQKIVGYFAHDLEQYHKLINLVFKGIRIGSKGGSRKKYNRQYAQREDFESELYRVENNTSEIITHEESQEVLQKARKKYRAIPKNDEEIEESASSVQNSDNQRKINRAFSANVTKKSLKLTVDYTIPIKAHLKKFILSLSDKSFSEDFSYDDFFFTVFLLSCLTGLGHEQIVSMVWEKNHLAVLNLNEKIVSVKLDKTLFAKEKNSEYMKKGGKEISYLIPPLMVILVRKIKLVLEMSLQEVSSDTQYKILQSKQVNKWYEQYISKKVKVFGKKIVIKPKQMWRMVEAYKKETLKEEMSTLFCVGKYQMIDRSKMAYTSTHNQGQIHAEFIVSLYNDLGMHEVISDFLNEDPLHHLPKGQIDTMFKYAGSSRSLDVESSKRFFIEMKKLILREENTTLHFNLISIYTKFALSILLGTRTFLQSTSLENISFSLHILSISEKASTLLSGIRVIPLCEKAEKIIKQYRYACDTCKIPHDDVYLLQKEKVDLYTKALAELTLKEVGADELLRRFVSEVPVNTGRHIVTNEARERNFNGYYLDAFLGHYSSGEEQLGIFSTLDMSDYIKQCRELMESIADKYGVLSI